MSLLTLTTSESLSWYTGYKPNNLWSDLKHARAYEHGEQNDPWSELRSDVVLMPIGMKASCNGAAHWSRLESSDDCVRGPYATVQCTIDYTH